MELFINGKNILGNSVKFDDIMAGDTIIHTIDGEDGIAEFWVGETAKKFQDEWWGPYRLYHAAPFEAEPVRVSPESGALIVARWHEESEGHRLFYAA